MCGAIGQLRITITCNNSVFSQSLSGQSQSQLSIFIVYRLLHCFCCLEILLLFNILVMKLVTVMHFSFYENRYYLFKNGQLIIFFVTDYCSSNTMSFLSLMQFLRFHFNLDLLSITLILLCLLIVFVYHVVSSKNFVIILFSYRFFKLLTYFINLSFLSVTCLSSLLKTNQISKT